MRRYESRRTSESSWKCHLTRRNAPGEVVWWGRVCCFAFTPPLVWEDVMKELVRITVVTMGVLGLFAIGMRDSSALTRDDDRGVANAELGNVDVPDSTDAIPAGVCYGGVFTCPDNGVEYEYSTTLDCKNYCGVTMIRPQANTACNSACVATCVDSGPGICPP